MTESKFTIELEERFGDKLKDKKKSTLSKFFKIKMNLLDEVYDRGLAAARSTGMRKSVKSPDRWSRARMNKFILNVVSAREGKKINNGAGEDGDVVGKAVGEVKDAPMRLKKSSRKNKKYVLKVGNKSVNFGQQGARDYTLMNDENSKFYESNRMDRERVKSNYQRRHKGDNLNDPFSAGALSYYLLWNKKTLKASIKDYEDRFKIKITL